MPYVILGVSFLIAVVLFFTLRKKAETPKEAFTPIFPSQHSNNTYRDQGEPK